MLAKQLIRTSLRAIKASAPSSARQSARITLPAAIQIVQSFRHEPTPVRWISQTPLRWEEDPQSKPPSSDNNSHSTANLPAVYLSNLSFSVTEESLTEFIQQHTPVKKVDVVRNTDGAIRGFGFAKYATEAEAEAAAQAINGLPFLGRNIVAAISQRRPMLSDASNQLFMSGFPTQGEADEAALRTVLYEKLGVQPRQVRFHKFPGGFLKGTGHLEFDDTATLEKILVKLQELGPDQPIVVNGFPLTLVKARPLLAPRSRSRGGFGQTRGPGYGGAAAGGYGGYPGEYSGQMGGYSSPPGGYQNQGYGNQYYPPPGQPFGGSDGYGSGGDGQRGGN